MPNHANGVIAVLSGPSGVGKDTLIRHITDSSGYRKFVAYTTRPMRSGEAHGKDYYFVTEDIFTQLLARHEFLDHITVDGNHYGTPIQDFVNVVAKKERVILHLAAETALLLRSRVENVKTVFVLPPSSDSLLGRLRKRGMSEEAISERIKNDPTSIDLAKQFDYVVTNYDGKQALTAKHILNFIDES